MTVGATVEVGAGVAAAEAVAETASGGTGTAVVAAITGERVRVGVALGAGDRIAPLSRLNVSNNAASPKPAAIGNTHRLRRSAGVPVVPMGAASATLPLGCRTITTVMLSAPPAAFASDTRRSAAACGGKERTTSIIVPSANSFERPSLHNSRASSALKATSLPPPPPLPHPQREREDVALGMVGGLGCGQGAG